MGMGGDGENATSVPSSESALKVLSGLLYVGRVYGSGQ